MEFLLELLSSTSDSMLANSPSASPTFPPTTLPLSEVLAFTDYRTSPLSEEVSPQADFPSACKLGSVLQP